MPIGKYIGCRVEIVYLNSIGRLTRKVVHVLEVTSKSVYAFDNGKQAYRTLRLQRILAVLPA
ncbi:WYL domain-containing protein [Cohnella fermenti]|uniref:WYL domain-containing protein n=1 Tax=Cohnella fermenti TaxID=2565925 RepID=A0A4S4C2K8_9BACL|nr:WYL domain-containing protein [Cohnella fermenti]THF81279.1 WYL domain-containing protein [Cohnella fermenti]